MRLPSTTTTRYSCVVLILSYQHHYKNAPYRLPTKAIKVKQEQKPSCRETVWFPGMDKQVRTELEHCLACQATAQPNHPEPIKTAPMPNSPWDKVKIDFYGPLPTGQYILVVIDCYSRFPEIEILTTISAQKVIQTR